jgi:hypothetical protein
MRARDAGEAMEDHERKTFDANIPSSFLLVAHTPALHQLM